MTVTKTLISLSKADGGLHSIALDYDDATVEAISEAAVALIQRHSMTEGDKLLVSNIEVEV